MCGNKREWCECVVSVSYMKSDPPSSAALSGPVRNGYERKVILGALRDIPPSQGLNPGDGSESQQLLIVFEALAPWIAWLIKPRICKALAFVYQMEICFLSFATQPTYLR